MVKGLEKFRDQFSDLKQCYVLIGGTACDLWMSERERQFRATEDLDIVLIVDELSPEFHERFWSFIQEGQYATHQQSEERPRFYRFEKPAHPDHPKRIELLSRGELDSPEGIHLAPIRSGEDLSSLSAILLDGVYYQYILDCRTEIEGIPTVRSCSGELYGRFANGIQSNGT